MKSFQLLFLFFFLSNTCSAQFDCNKIEIVGIYDNNRNTDQLSLILTNSSEVDDGNENVYTSITLIESMGDTIFNSGEVYSLPNQLKDTIVYNIPLYKNFTTIYELPDYRSGEIIMQFPSCNIPYSYDSLIVYDLPLSANLDCDDFEMVGMYRDAHNYNYFSALITNTNQDSSRNWLTGYTSFQLTDNNGITLTEETSPSFSIPEYGDTLIVHFEFDEDPIDKEIILHMKDPVCQVPFSWDYISSLDRTIESPLVDIYPNPCIDQLGIKSNEEINRVVIFDNYGRNVLDSKSHSIDVSKLKSGIYFVQIEFSTYKVLEKMFKL